MISLTSAREVGQVRVLENGATAVPLRPKNQVTLPAEIARALGARPGDRLQFAIDPENPETATVRRIRESYLGALAGVYGETHEEQLAYLRAEQYDWAD